MGKLSALKSLNMSDNCVKFIPHELGNLRSLKSLFIHGNRFTNFPCSLVNLEYLEEFSLEWFLYAKPAKPKIVKKNMNDGRETLE